MNSSRQLPFNLRVFISSTFSDLEEYRQAAFEAIQSLGAHGDDMIYWSADERSGVQHSVDRVRQCDVVVLLLAHRYGYVAEGASLGVTELEYQSAREAGIPVLAFVVDESVPWPPERIEFEKLEQLKAFKQRIEKDVTRKLFRSTDELGRLVTQALALLMQRRQGELAQAKRYQGVSLVVDSSMTLRTQPDGAIHIGTAEDGLPLVLQVRRSHDLSPYLDGLGAELNSDQPAEALLSNFRQALEAHGRANWARERITAVRCTDGQQRDLFVSKANLADLFRSVLSSALADCSGHVEGPDETSHVYRTAISVVNVPSLSAIPHAALKSEGGVNRFLGIDLASAEISSVGRDDGRWVQWRPFHFESITHAFPDAMFVTDQPPRARASLADLQKVLMDLALADPSDDGRVSARVALCIPRQTILLLLAEVADCVGEMHQRGLVHGDLKPANIVLGENGPLLIDEFAVPEGSICPGWTPTWSAPEQTLCEPATAASDIYPIGRMIVDVLGGELVGEVRKFRARSIVENRAQEFDVFYNPSVFVAPSEVAVHSEAVSAWQKLARKCLAFSPAERPKSGGALAKLIRDTAAVHHFPGEARITVPGELRVVRLLDGRQVVARIIADGGGVPEQD